MLPLSNLQKGDWEIPQQFNYAFLNSKLFMMKTFKKENWKAFKKKEIKLKKLTKVKGGNIVIVDLVDG